MAEQIEEFRKHHKALEDEKKAIAARVKKVEQMEKEAAQMRDTAEEAKIEAKRAAAEERVAVAAAQKDLAAKQADMDQKKKEQQKMQAKLQAQTAHLEMEFPYFLVKKAPVSGKEGVLDYNVRFDAAMNGNDLDFLLTVRVTVTTLCPCSKAISKYGAHNQRGEVTVQVRSDRIVWIEEIISLVESSCSSEMYSLLKREDEKAVTERAYENPVFVEDLVRNVALRLNAHPDVAWYKVEAENYESIHNHNAYACIEKG
jgi:GTP cyclohydrolase I